MKADWRLLSASPWASIVFSEFPENILPVPGHFAQDITEYRRWLQKQIRQFGVEEVVLDTFPCGLLGEWNLGSGFPGKKLVYTYIARALRWEAYRKLMKSPPFFQKSYRVEPLEAAQESFIKQNSGEVADLVLDLPLGHLPLPVKDGLLRLQAQQEELWLIVHSGSQEEIATLVAYAQDCARIEQKNPVYWLVSPQDSLQVSTKTLKHISLYPAHKIFPWASCVFTGGGFNCMWEASQYPLSHKAYPFARRYDDQFARVARFREGFNL